MLWFAAATLCVVVLVLVPGDTGLALERLAVTLPLALIALGVALAIGVVLTATLFSRRHNPSVLLRGLSLLPAFAIGLLLIWLLAVPGFLPGSGFVPWQLDPLAALQSLLLPALALGVPHGLALTRLTLEALRRIPAEREETLQLDGLSAQDARRQAALEVTRATLPGLIARLFGAIVVGTAVVETLFYLPGLGRQMLGAALSGDLPLLLEGSGWLLAVAAIGMLLATLPSRHGPTT